MDNSIVVALISSAVTILGVILANSKSLAVINNEIKHLTEEVKRHNNFAQRMPVLGVHLEELTKRVETLERKSNGKD